MPRPTTPDDHQRLKTLRSALARVLGDRWLRAIDTGDKSHETSLQRWVAARLLHELDMSTPQIAVVLGLRSHSSVVESLGHSQPSTYWAGDAMVLMADFHLSIKDPAYRARTLTLDQLRRAWISMCGERLPRWRSRAMKAAS